MEKIKNEDLEKLESERTKISKESSLFYFIGGILLVVGIILMFLYPVASIPFFLVAVVLIIVGGSKASAFAKRFKAEVVEKLIFQELGPEARYIQNGGISMAEINALKVAMVPDRHHEEDYIAGKYNDVPFELCDCTMEERVVTTDGKGNRIVSYDTYFKGRIIKIDFQRNLNMELRVVNNAPRGFSKNGLTPFETEVIDFNKAFKSYASSQEDGFYLLTPVMISKMQELERMYKGGIAYIIMNNIFYIFINNSGDSLEVNIRKPINDQQLQRLRSDISIAPTIINEFKIDKDKFNVDRKI